MQIMKALRRCGVAVEFIGEPLDLILCHRGETALAEVKTDGGRFTKRQVEFMARWPGRIFVFKTPEQAVQEVVGG